MAAHTDSAAAATTIATDAPSPVAPPQLFASPFLPEHERAIVAVLAELHPDLKISRSTLTVLQRFCDRLAHYLLHRAYHGLNGGMESKLDPLVTAASPSSVTTVQSSAAVGSSSSSSSAAPSSSSSSSVPEDAHSIHFAFDAPLWIALGALCRRVHTEAVSVQTRLSEVGEAGLQQLTGVAYLLMLPIVLADRWLQDFTLGLRLTDDDAVLPPALLSTQQKVKLCVIVEYILAELLRVGGNLANSREATSLLPSTLWLTVENNAEQQPLCAFLPVNWRIDTQELDSPMQLACASQPLDAAQHSMRFLEPAFAPHFTAQAELDRSSWYHDPAAVIETARLAARGALTEASIIRQLREAHVRPLRFWGVDTAALLAFRDPEESEDGARPEREYAFVSFLLTDAHGREFTLLLRGDRGENIDVECHVTRDPLRPVLRLAVSFTVEHYFDGAVSRQINVRPSALADYEPHGRVCPRQLVSAIHASTPAAVAASSSGSVTSSSSSSSVVAATAQPSLEAKRQQKQTWQRISVELEAAVHAAMPLLKFSLYGPTLFADNHPPQMRRLFTAHLIDSCMLESGLRPLPLVLSELISEFHSFDLPFRQDKATEQMRQAGFKPRQQDSSKATYEGQLDSAIEDARDLEAELNHQFPVRDYWAADDQNPPEDDAEEGLQF